MQILLSCAKIMNSDTKVSVPHVTLPMFQADASRFALELCQWSVDKLAKALHCSKALAEENHLRYGRFLDEAEKLPAILAYNGQAYKYLRASEFNNADFEYAQDHVFICSFLYGLLRPLDNIHPYRLEGTVQLHATGGQPMFTYWRSRLTDVLIDAVKADDGVLVHLTTDEMEHLFDWKRVCRELTVVQPLFYADEGFRLKAVPVHMKSCRGAMTREIVQNRFSAPSDLLDFEQNGYRYRENYGDALHPHFIK
jgi:cytoplasmic iron level regulating protein YaaA (DUF328/UPF0246 family)